MANVYSFLDVHCAITGPGGIVNLASGAGASEEGITFTPTEELNTMVIGADGTGMHSLHAGRSGSVTVRLLKTSPTNQLLAAMVAFQTASASSHGQNTISMVDMARGDAITAQQVAFKRRPDLSYGTQAGTVEWQFDAVKIDIALGS